MSNSDELPYWVGLNLVRGIGPAKFRALLDFFGSAGKAWQADPHELTLAGLDRRAVESFLRTRSSLNPHQEVAKAVRDNIRICTWDDDDYPRYLKEIPDPPPVLYVKGELQTRDEWSIAIVGTRHATSYGKFVTRQLVQELARNGATIVSGLARGIDSIAHQAALDAGGRTLAVLGSGIRKIYPPEHRRMADQIAESGAIISDFSPDTPPEAGNFPRRNRIISGLSLGVLVIEAGIKSGALITANYALDQGRDVFAVPGNINSRMSYGTNRLIQQGARMVVTSRDILEELNMTMVAEQVATQLSLPASQEEAQLLQLLSDAPCHVDDLSRCSALPVAQVTSTLTMMELKGMVRQVESMSFVRIRDQREVYS